jgi:hypothetical protein
MARNLPPILRTEIERVRVQPLCFLRMRIVRSDAVESGPFRRGGTAPLHPSFLETAKRGHDAGSETRSSSCSPPPKQQSQDPTARAGLRPRRLRRRFTPDATATAKAASLPARARGFPQSSALRLCRPSLRLPLRLRLHLRQQGWVIPLPFALATHTRMAGGQGVSVRTATAKPFKSQGATNMCENSGEQIEEGEGEQSPAPLAVPA